MQQQNLLSAPLDKTSDRLTVTGVRKQQACNINSTALFWWQSDVAHLLSFWKPKCFHHTALLQRSWGGDGAGDNPTLTLLNTNLVGLSETQRRRQHGVSKSLGVHHQCESGHKPGFCQQRVTCILSGIYTPLYSLKYCSCTVNQLQTPCITSRGGFIWIK